MAADFERPHDLIAPPRIAAPFLFNAPHSGRVYPAAFREAARLDDRTLRKSEDAFVDDLFIDVVDQGAMFLRANFPRAYVDVNREPYELDPAMFDGDLPHFVNTRSVRVAGGLGTIARIVSEREEIYRRRLSVAEALYRIDALYKPYHRALAGALERLRAHFGVAVLIDCHSMPSLRGEATRRADFVLGDRFNTSCASIVIDIVHNRLRRLGYSVTRNKPYAGGYITEFYGRPETGIHALQIEVNRGLYMDEEQVTKSARFAQIQQDLMRVCEELMSLTARDLDIGAAAQ